MVERWPEKPSVAGSIPASGTGVKLCMQSLAMDTELEDFLADYRQASTEDQTLLEILLGPLQNNRYVRREPPQVDAFLGWFGLGDSKVLGLKRQAGLVTSIYRQLGIGCERVLRHLIQSRLDVPADQCTWAWQSDDGRKYSLDARISSSEIGKRREEYNRWLAEAARVVGGGPYQGSVFEVRQGLKSADSKRATADCVNARAIGNAGYLPVLLIFSTQIQQTLEARYRREGWLVLTGRVGGSAVENTYTFFREVFGFDVAKLLEDNQANLKKAILEVLSP